MNLEQKVARLLSKKHKSLAIAESCTGGLLTDRLTNVPGSSSFLKIGIIAYSNEAKTRLLKVPPATIRRYGAVSRQTALAMARSIRRIHKTDLGIAITGIAGPAGGSRVKPVGLTYIAVSTVLETLCFQYVFSGSRIRVKSKAATEGLKLLYRFLT